MMILFRKSFAILVLRNRENARNREKELSREPFPTTLGRGGVGSPSLFACVTGGGLLFGDGKPLPEHSEETGRWLAGKRVSGRNDEPNGQ
jgi:hypothetical protein